jgi:hypothetical protein
LQCAVKEEMPWIVTAHVSVLEFAAPKGILILDDEKRR